MGFFSDIQNYHSADEHTNENIETEFGTPIRTLYTELDPGDLHQRIEVKDITNIQGLNWKIKGNIIGLNFTLFDEHDEVIAAIGQKIVSVHDRYSIDLYQTQHEQVVAAILISLQKMLTSRRERNR